MFPNLLKRLKNWWDRPSSNEIDNAAFQVYLRLISANPDGDQYKMIARAYELTYSFIENRD